MLAATIALADLSLTSASLAGVWTVDKAYEMQSLAALGVDAIITNVPDVAVAALTA